MQTSLIDYQDGNIELEGFLAAPNNVGPKTPVVMVIHDWTGKNNFACQKAEAIANLGYIGFALDMYGKGKLGQTKEQKSALIQPFLQDRSLVMQRINAALNTVKNIPNADTSKVAAIGFCFGGLCVLDLARSGSDVRGVVSFHGLFTPPPHPATSIKAKVLALQGYDDPMANPDQAMQFCEEMKAANADWQLHLYGATMHAFMNPEANDPAFGTVFNPTTAARAWRQMTDFLSEIFQ